jgi:beta-lactam-binding protein with PASTA domain
MLGDSLRRRQRRGRPGRRSSGKRPSCRFWIAGLLLALVVPFAIGYLLTVFVIFPPLEVAPAGLPVPSLYGLTVVQAERALAQAGLGSLRVVLLPHPTTPEGDVIAQSPLPGQQLRRGRDVRAAVSSGPVQVRVPDLLGQPAERAEERLLRLGFTLARVDTIGAIAAGRVIALDPPPGTMTRLPALVTLRVSLGPPPDSLALDSLGLDSLALPDTLGAGR